MRTPGVWPWGRSEFAPDFAFSRTAEFLCCRRKGIDRSRGSSPICRATRVRFDVVRARRPGTLAVVRGHVVSPMACPRPVRSRGKIARRAELAALRSGQADRSCHAPGGVFDGLGGRGGGVFDGLGGRGGGVFDGLGGRGGAVLDGLGG